MVQSLILNSWWKQHKATSLFNRWFPSRSFISCWENETNKTTLKPPLSKGYRISATVLAWDVHAEKCVFIAGQQCTWNLECLWVKSIKRYIYIYKSCTKKDRLSPVEFLSSYFCVPVLQCEQFTALAQWQEWHKHTKLSWRPHVHLLLLSSYCLVGKCLGYCMPSCWFGWHHDLR